MEIERKFLVRQMPEGQELAPRRHIIQAYISTDPVIRIRRSEKGCTLTVKGRGTLCREELNLPLSPEAFERLMKKAEGRIIEKTRWLIPLGEHTVELDVFSGDLAPLVLAEVEFDSPEAALAFRPPCWFGDEVTEDPRYTNAYLSTL